MRKHHPSSEQESMLSKTHFHSLLYPMLGADNEPLDSWEIMLKVELVPLCRCPQDPTVGGAMKDLLVVRGAV